MQIKIIQQLYKDDIWKIELAYYDFCEHDKYVLSISKRTNKYYAHRREISFQSYKEEYFFITQELNLHRKSKPASENQWRKTLIDIQKEANCNVITSEHLETLKSAYLFNYINKGN